jgi:hypothetical protein
VCNPNGCTHPNTICRIIADLAAGALGCVGLGHPAATPLQNAITQAIAPMVGEFFADGICDLFTQDE